MKGENAMKYVTPEMEANEFEVEDILFLSDIIGGGDDNDQPTEPTEPPKQELPDDEF